MFSIKLAFCCNLREPYFLLILLSYHAETLTMRITYRHFHPASQLLLFLVAALPTLSFADEFTVASHPSLLRLAPGRPVENSPGARPGAVVTCNRVHLHGLSRFRDLDKFFHVLKLSVSVSQGDGLFRLQTVELCLHRNASLGIGMCTAGHWRKLSKGSLVRSLSPFEDWFVDVRMLPNPSSVVEVTTELEFLSHRVVFLVLSFCMMIMAHPLSQSITFYYGGGMTIGVILVILMVLYQGMKLLPTGRKSSLAIVMYSSIVGIAASLLQYISGILRAALVEIGIYEDMHKPLGVLLLVCLILVGAWFGFYCVRKGVLTEDGLVDTEVAYFVEWAILIFAGIMLLQSSLDIILAAEALAIAIIMSTVSRTHGKLTHLRRLFRTFKCIYSIFSPIHFPNLSEYTQKFKEFGSASPTQTKNWRTAPGMSRTSPKSLSEGYDHYSTFHNTPERQKFTKEEWEEFTREGTRKALRELVSSPDFSRWATENAERIIVTPRRNARRVKNRRIFQWWS